MIRSILVATALFAFAAKAQATDRYFDDITALSPSGRFEVQAKSPANLKTIDPKPFQSSFIYACRDKQTGKLLWGRKQPMGEPKRIFPNSKETITFPKEGEPIQIFVSDSGMTVIRTAWDELLIIDITGHQRGRIEIMKSGLTAEEKSKYVERTTAGAFWSQDSTWNFRTIDKKELFVIRPWWGRHLVVDLFSGKLNSDIAAFEREIAADERKQVIRDLTQAVKDLEERRKQDFYDRIPATITAVHFAGKHQITETGPLIEKLQTSAYSGRSQISMQSLGSDQKGVDPSNFSVFTLRQAAHLALRRLGIRPQPIPLTQFESIKEGESNASLYVPPARPRDRAQNVNKVKEKMSPENVIDLIGEPDYADDAWEYDIDAPEPFSLTIHWEDRKVTKIEIHRTPLWKTGETRDRQLIML